MSNREILMNLISTYGSLNQNQNKKIINDYFENNQNLFKLNDFIKYYNSNTNKPINDYAIYMFFRYMK